MIETTKCTQSQLEDFLHIRNSQLFVSEINCPVKSKSEKIVYKYFDKDGSNIATYFEDTATLYK